MHDRTTPTQPDGLTDAERAEYDRLVGDVREADASTFRAALRLGVLLLALVAFRERTPRHARARTWAEVAADDLAMDVSRTYQLMDFARVDDALRAAGAEPLTRESHARAVAPLLRGGSADRLPSAVGRARALAAAEGRGLTARHLEAARREVDPAPDREAPERAGPDPGGAEGHAAGGSADGEAAPTAPGLTAEAPENPAQGGPTPEDARPEDVPSGGDDWPWSDEARARFDRVPRVDREAVREALVPASLSGDVTAETVADAAEAVRHERAEDGGRSGRPAVVGLAVAVVEANRRSLLDSVRPVAQGRRLLQADIDYVDEGAGSSPLLVVVPAALCPDALLDAHPGARGLVRGRAEVVVEVNELHAFGGPFLDEPDADGRPVLDVRAVREAARAAGIRKTLNDTGQLIGWANFSTNGSTGCSHTCSRRFCYASDLALKFYPQAFVPTVHPARLDAFANTAVPDPDRHPEWARPWARSVFYGSMTDVMNRSFPDWWVQAVIDEVRANPQWHVFFLTKLAHRLGDFEWPANSSVGVTVTGPHEVRAAAAGLRSVRGAANTWVSVEPYLEAFDPAPLLDAGATFFAVGGQSATRWDGEKQPDPAWVRDLIAAVWARGGHVYVKDNLDFRGHIPFPGHDPYGGGPAPAGGRPAPAEVDRGPVRRPVRPLGPRGGRPAPAPPAPTSP